MTKRARFTLFLAMFAAFIIVSLIIVPYIQGYRFDFEKFSISKTGGIYLKTNPSKANIFINQKLLNKKTPALINGLLPKNFNIRIEKDNFYAWEKRIKVEQGLISEAMNIVLVPQDPQVNIISSPEIKIKKIQSSPRQNFFLIIRDDDLGLINERESYTINLNEYFPNLPQRNALLRAIEKNNIAWHNNETKIITHNEEKNYILDFRKQTVSQFSINNTDIKKSGVEGLINPGHIQWHPLADESILFIYNNSLYSYNLQNNTSKILLSGVVYFKPIITMLVSYIYYIDEAGFAHRYNLTTKNDEKIFRIPFKYDSAVTLLISPDHKKIAWWNTRSQEIFLIFEDNIKILEKVNFAEFSDDSQKMVYGDKNQVWVIFLENDNNYPLKYKGVAEKIINSDSSNIIAVSWYSPTNQHLLIMADEVYLTELDDRPPRNSYPVLKNTPNDVFINGEKIYYINDGKFYFLDIKKQQMVH